jgi:hypothetical protein
MGLANPRAMGTDPHNRKEKTMKVKTRVQAGLYGYGNCR